ncbi:glutamate 5-kinase [Demequina sp. NBRC 110054]|uniref:glutamate 5-kinase n=1 Tax=Demequina sp. NBRC 110054 TaxID=1570343 RepID=UPI000A00E922|nr:glutamate 5-kinase [Demequina sp. NBRC 110054]
MSEHLRDVVARASRIVVKVGSSSLTGDEGRLDKGRLGALVDVLAHQAAGGREIILVTSGSIAAGIGPLGLEHRPTNLELQQAAASVGQGKLIHAYTQAFGRHGLDVGQVLLTSDDMVRRAHYGNARRALESLLSLGVVPIINENDTVATDEIRFGDNDRLAALVATAMAADALILLTDVDALYTAAPGTPGAHRISVVHGPEDLGGIDISRRGSAVGTGGMITKVEAASIATTSGVHVVLARADDAGAALEGADVGTLFMPTGKRDTTRLQWLAHAARTRGGIVLDDGAVRAVMSRRASLLAAGVVEIRGHFEAGEPVDLLSVDGTLVARGFAGFSAEEAERMKGLSTDALGERLGDHYARELIHIDHLVVL